MSENPFRAEIWFVHHVLVPIGHRIERRFGKGAHWLFALLMVLPLARLWFGARADYEKNRPR